MVQNKRRMEGSTGTAGVSANFIDVDFPNDTVVNVHGYRAEFAIEPQDADANCNGSWAVWVLPGGVIQNADLPNTFGSMFNEDFAPYLWGIGVYVASNQTPHHMLFAPKSTRNIQVGGRIVFHIRIDGISAGLARLNTSQTMFTSAVK